MAVTRRDFLRLSAAGALAAQLPDAFAGDRTVNAWSTGGKLRHAKVPGPAWSSSAPTASNAITIEPAEEYQSILGFGGAFTDSACTNLQRLEPAARKRLFHQL